MDVARRVPYNRVIAPATKGDGLREAPTPTLAVVSGPPGSGKTTLAHALAAAIPCPAVCRDEIKEGMVHAHGPGFEAAPGDALTQRTFPLFFDVLRLLVEGRSDREIGEALFIGTRTVQTHVSNLFAKLGVNARAEAAAVAVRRGLV
jgi:DNA-binding NarL/FixJ family response regulator